MYENLQSLYLPIITVGNRGDEEEVEITDLIEGYTK